jgi:hypothetical protein
MGAKLVVAESVLQTTTDDPADVGLCFFADEARTRIREIVVYALRKIEVANSQSASDVGQETSLRVSKRRTVGHEIVRFMEVRISRGGTSCPRTKAPVLLDSRAQR